MRDFDKAMAWLQDLTASGGFYNGGMALDTLVVLKDLRTAARHEREEVGKLHGRLRAALAALTTWRDADRAQANYERLCAELAEEDDATIDDAAAFALERGQAARELRDAVLTRQPPYEIERDVDALTTKSADTLAVKLGVDVEAK